MNTNIPLKQQTAVQAGKLEDSVKSLVNWFKKGIKSLIDLGLKVSSEVTYDDFGNQIIKVETGGKNKLYVKVKDLDNPDDKRPGFFALKGYNAADMTKQSDTMIVKEENIGDAITKFIDELFEESVERAEDKDGQDVVHNSKRVNIQLKRIVGNTEDEIVAEKVYCNCDTTLARSIIDSAMASDELIETISEEPVLLAVIDDGTDNLDVQPCEDLTSCCTNPILMLLGQAIKLRDAALVHRWNNPTEGNWSDITYTAADECNFLGQLYVEKIGICPEVSDFVNMPETTLGDLTSLRDKVSIHADALEMFLPNFDTDVQVQVAQFIRLYNQYTDYFNQQ